MLTRRRALQLGAAGALVAPYTRLLAPARAAPARPTRLLIWFTPNGIVPQTFKPTGAGSGYQLPAGSVLEPLDAWREQLLVVDGINFYGADNHEGGMAAMLTGSGGAADTGAGRSVDQHLAAWLGAKSRFPSLELGVQTSLWGGSSQTRMCYAGPGSYVTPDDDPRNVYTRLFGDAAGDAEAAARNLAHRRSILDLVSGELDTLHAALGHEEQVRLEAHLEALRSVERSLEPSDTCAPPEMPDVSAPTSNDSFPDVVRAQTDLAVLALACEATPVVTIQNTHTISPTVFTWLGESEGHHSLSHADDTNTSGIESYVACERWFAEQFGYLLERLAATTDAAGAPLLDSTVVLWARELGDGRAHVCTDVPWVFAGAVPTELGRYLSLGGVNHAHLLVSLCQWFGLEDDTFGNPAAGSGAAELA